MMKNQPFIKSSFLISICNNQYNAIQLNKYNIPYLAI